MHGSTMTPNHPGFSVAVGIASLVLEGRALSDDDFLSHPIIPLQSSTKLSNLPNSFYATNQLNSIRTLGQHSTSVTSGSTTSTADRFRLRQKLILLNPSSSTNPNNGGGGGVGESSSSGGLLSLLLRSNNTENAGIENDVLVENRNKSPEINSLMTITSNYLQLNWEKENFVRTHRATDVGQTQKKVMQGAHCEEFLTKIGLIKGDTTSKTAIRNHVCTTDVKCCQWNHYYSQLISVLEQGDIICIEVYLGPENRRILLEQWTIECLILSSHQPTITIQSLCSAIRSQLYFSQITAWTELIKKSPPMDSAFELNPRIRRSPLMKQPQLDIYYSIKSYNETFSPFVTKPNIHCFPEVKIDENRMFKVTLRSLPRMDNIPDNDTFFKVPAPSPVKEVTEPLLTDHCLVALCKETGKHRCPLNEIDEIDNVSSSSNSPPPPPIDSHREKQLRKYMKRLDRRKKRAEPNPSDSEGTCGSTVQQHSPSRNTKRNCENNENTMEKNKILKKQTSAAIESTINSIQPPLYSPPTSLLNESSTIMASTSNINCSRQLSPMVVSPVIGSISSTFTVGSSSNTSAHMISVSTQTDNNSTTNEETAVDGAANGTNRKFPNCNYCGIEMQFICWNCDKRLLVPTPNDTLNSGDRLMQSIHQTPRQNCLKSLESVLLTPHWTPSTTDGSQTSMDTDKHRECDNVFVDHGNNAVNRNGNNVNMNSILLTPEWQKHDNRMQINDEAAGHDQSSDTTSCKNIICDNTINNSGRTGIEDDCVLCKRQKIMHNFNLNSDVQFSHNNNNLVVTEDNQPVTPPMNGFKTPGGSDEKLASGMARCSFGKQLPKVNLSAIFSMNDNENGLVDRCRTPPELRHPCLSTPIPTSKLFDFETNGLSESSRSSSCSNLTVQKSHSAPTIATASCLSSRFIKSSNNIRRLRYLSDRSERSSVGSDELYSDEDSELSPAVSPIKTIAGFKPFAKASMFCKRPMLGTFEESLLQRRLMPKIQVPGFKVLLGASGTKQQSLPATSYFYELDGPCLSTPYVCEVRLGRKGYTVPRVGNVQVILLNPLGTVVRIFAIYYNLTDMPKMSQTFIRQRHLAIDEKTHQGRKAAELTLDEQMKALRYSIHLRFQTSRSGRLALHSDIRMLVSRRTDTDTAVAHATSLASSSAPSTGGLEQTNELEIFDVKPSNPIYSTRTDLK